MNILFSSKTAATGSVIKTPAQYEIILEPGKKKTRVRLNADQVKPSTHMTAEWHYWAPSPETPLPPARLYWTKQYIGTDENFYQQGFRWGVSIGGTPEEFKRSALYLPGGGINLPNGKYMIAIKKNAAGKIDVVLGREDRGTDKRTIEAFKKGILPETNQFNEILGVSNHSMLIARGKPFVPGSSIPDEFSAAFAGEIEIVNNHINTINDQTGQIFGPNGLMKPPGEAKLPDDMVIKQHDYEDGKSVALKEARDTLASLTGDNSIRLVKVRFFNDGLSEEDLKAGGKTKVKNADPKTLAEILQQKNAQALFDQFQNTPENQLRLIKALAKHSEMLPAILDLQRKLVERGTLKPEQGTVVALELLVTPEAIGLFVPESPYFIPGLSDNTKRKLLSAYNAQNKEDRGSFKELVLNLKHERQLVRFLTGQRVPGSLFKQLLPSLDKGSECASLVYGLLSKSRRLSSAEAYDISNTNAVVIGHISKAGKQLRELKKKVAKKGGKNVHVILQNNPFNGTILKLDALKKNIALIQGLQEKGVTVYAGENFTSNRTYEYLKDLFAFAQPPLNSEDAIDRQDINTLMEGYGVEPEDLYQFVRERFQKRWGNNQIIMAYAFENKAFRSFLRDVEWSVSLPIASN